MWESETGGEQAEDKGKEGKTERQEGAEEATRSPGAAGKHSEHEAQENRLLKRAGKLYTDKRLKEAEKMRSKDKGEMRVKRQEKTKEMVKIAGSQKQQLKEEQGGVSKERECGHGEAEGDQRAGGERGEEGSLLKGPQVAGPGG